MKKHYLYRRHAFLRISVALIIAAVSGILLFRQLNSQPQDITAVQADSAMDVTGANRFGIASGSGMDSLSASDLAKYLDDYKALGAKWIRMDFPWSSIQSAGQGSYNFAKLDAVVAAASARGIAVVATLDYTPAWARPPSCTSSDKCAPDASHIADYGTFAATTAAHYAPMGVHHWEIWNEPNIRFWLPSADPATYTQLLKAGYSGIKSKDPSATVITGGTAPASTNGTDMSPYDYLSGIYAHGGKGYFDAVGHHPYCSSAGSNCPKTYYTWSAWSQMNDTPQNLRAVMTANGDSAKKIWATEFGVPTNGQSSYVTEAQQATMVSDAYALFSSYQWAGPLFWYSYHDKGTATTDRENFYGLLRYDFSRKPAYGVYKALTAAYLTTTSPPANPATTKSSTPSSTTSGTSSTGQPIQSTATSTASQAPSQSKSDQSNGTTTSTLTPQAQRSNPSTAPSGITAIVHSNSILRLAGMSALLIIAIAATTYAGWIVYSRKKFRKNLVRGDKIPPPTVL